MKEKVIVITGASRGIGEDIALAFAGQHAKLVLVARNPEDLERVRGRAMEAGAGDVLTVTTDVSKEDEVEVMVEVTLSRFGRIDILVNNAGIGYFKPVQETSLEEWQSMFDINVTGLFLCTRGVLPAMLEQGAGHIINISSDVGRRTFAGGAAYVATKHAVQGFADCLRKEVQAKGVKVTNILPGMTDTYFAESEQGAEHKKEWLKADDIARAVLFAASQPEGVLVDDITIHPMIQEY
ncbi:SDR family oxidoreductase [Effusibacillus lacus]|uniref:Short-chain dehydrogenasee n=1 Tax=Effusibacillus lacus TaxID=1348429 RepID=A0A292YGZ8_9BACL|nr:SDR family oxidoreductase [Effusibacillus lacus]TCS74331.1 NADP-dependent 3-hydroxy acid dehydrogenase YdfG [Effusibacillus lacus]GAX88788.1 short-chain dehydrogenasee [Effusibacillus lacus]